MEKVIVKVKVLPGGRMPEKKTAGAAAWDCYVRMDQKLPGVWYSETEKHWLYVPVNGKVFKIPLGFALEMPEGVAAFIAPRSSLGTRTGLSMPNSIGLIDSDYRGEVNALLREIDPGCDVGVSIHNDSLVEGDRIVQMFFNVPNVELVRVDELSETARGEGGFGSTGKR